MKKTLGIFSASLLFTAVVVFRLFPLHLKDAADRFGLWRSGLREVVSVAGDRGVAWESRECRFAEAEARSCTCVVFVHGMSDSVVTWKKLLAKRDWLERVREPIRLVAWDLPGHGRTPEPPRNADGDLQLRAQLLAQRLLGATQQQGCESPSVWVGNSLGGWVASWVALKRPDQVRGLILLGPAGLRSQRIDSVGSGILEEPTVESLKEFRARAYAKMPDDYPDWVWQAAIRRVKQSPVHRVRKVQQDEDDLDTPIRSVQVPSWVIWGRQDRILPLEKSLGFRQIPAASLRQWVEVDQCGHLPQKECPEPVRSAIVEALLSKG